MILRYFNDFFELFKGKCARAKTRKKIKILCTKCQNIFCQFAQITGKKFLCKMTIKKLLTFLRGCAIIFRGIIGMLRY